MSGLAAIAARARALDSAIVLGIDPPLAAGDDLAALWRRIAALIAACAPVCAAAKPNTAFFEARGAAGMQLLADVADELRAAGLPLLLDGKRGDIASTADAYAVAARRLGAAAVTLHAWMGADSVTPFLATPGLGVFVLARTSNPTAAALLDLTVRGGDGATRPLYAEVVRQWADHPDEVGFVVGATAPQAVATARALAPAAWLLAPGLGAQGGDLAAVVAAGLAADGHGLLLPLSRALWAAEDPAAAAARWRDDVRCQRDRLASPPAAASSPALLTGDRGALADGLIACGAVRFGAFRLKSGISSPIYLDLRLLTGFPDLLRLAARLLAAALAPLRCDRIAALPLAGLPLGTATALHADRPLVFPRAQAKDHGTRALVEGPFVPGETAVLLDDLATRGTSALELVAPLRAAGLVVRDMVVLVDRLSGAGERLAADGIALHAALDLHELLGHWCARGAIDAAREAEVRAFVAGSRG